MTLLSLMDGAAGRPGVGSSGTQPPATVTATSGGWLTGSMFSVSGQMAWLYGYRQWVPGNGDKTARTFALWNRTSTSAQNFITGSSVTSGPLAQSTFNTVLLPTPIQIAPAALYIGQMGYTATAGIPVTSNQFGAAQPYAAGIVNSILQGWSGLTGSFKFPAAAQNYNLGQNLFSNVLGADPTAAMANNGSGDDLLWTDIIVSDTAPATYTGSYRLYPNKGDLGNFSLDTANNFTLGLEFTLSVACTFNRWWFYTPATVTQLPTACGIFRVSDHALIASQPSPSWSGAAGSAQWISAATAGPVILPAGTYRLGILNGAAVPAIWNAAVANWWDTGFGASGLTAGPIFCPNTASAHSPGQDSFHQGATMTYPDTNVGAFEYGLDLEVTPVPPAVPVTGGGGTSMLARSMKWADL
jgi:hypothetical protein